jgi:outer membrane protein
MKHFFCLIGSITIFSLGYAPSGRAQDPLSLGQAVERGLAQNFGILIERRAVEANRVNNDWGQAGRYPTVNFNFGQNNNFTNVDNPASFVQGTTINNNFTPSANINWVIFDGFRVRLTKARLDALQRNSEGNARVVVENTVQAIMLTYYNAVRAKARMDILARNLGYTRAFFDFIKLKQEVGSAVITDVLLAKNNYLADSSNLLNQQVVYRNAVRDLNVLLAETDVRKTYQLADSLPASPEVYDYDDLKTKTFASNANLQAQYLAQELLRNQVALQRSDLQPSLQFNLNGAYTRNRQNLERAIFPGGQSRANNTAITQNYLAGFQFTMPLFNGGQLRRAVETAQIAEDAGLLRVDALKLALERDLAEAHDLYNLRQGLVVIARENLTAAETNLELSIEKFRAGSINAFDFTILQNVYLEAAFAQVQARFNVLEAKITLLRLTGGILAEPGR